MLHDLQFTILQRFEYESITLFFKYNVKQRKECVNTLDEKCMDPGSFSLIII